MLPTLVLYSLRFSHTNCYSQLLSKIMSTLPGKKNPKLFPTSNNDTEVEPQHQWLSRLSG